MNYAEPELASQRVARAQPSGYDYYDQSSDAGEDVGAAIDIRAMLAAVYRNRYYILGILLVALLLGLASVFLATPRYRATASVQIDQRTTKVLGTEEYSSGEGRTEGQLSPMKSDRR